jgi:FkbM family methyltransferase
MSFQGQFGEPQFLDKYFKGKMKGVAVEVGAYDGISLSNTYYFEKHKNWNCICIEPITDKFDQCKRIRNKAINCCVGKEKGTAEFTVFDTNNNDTSAISGLNPDIRLIESHKHLITGSTKIHVNIRTLTEILDSENFPKDIDFVSIDTENTELDVLKGFDLNKYNVKVLLIENNYDEPFHYDYIKQFGYKKIARLGVNDFYEK